jgi:uncharacterized membrane protein YccC
VIPIRQALRDAGADLLGRGAEARQTVRVMAGTVIAFAIYHLFNLPQGYWAVFTVVIVMQASIGGTLAASVDRMKGTVLGAVVGGFAAWLHPRTPVGLGAAMTISVGVTAFAAAMRPSLKVAPVTAVIMLISPSGGALGPLISAVYRVIEIAVGSVIGVLATVLIFPARSTDVVVARMQEVLALMAGVLEGYAAGMSAPLSLDAHNDVQLRIRTTLAGIEAAMADADRERSSRLGQHRLSDALPRTLWRVRNDEVSISRALGPMPEAISQVIGDATQDLMRAEAGFMRACADALAAERLVERGEREEKLKAFEAAIATLRQSHLTHDLDFDAVGHLFGLAFALESLHRNLSDLGDRIDETAKRASTRF